MTNKHWTEIINGRSWSITQRLVGTPQTYYMAKSLGIVHTNKKLPALMRKLREKSEGFVADNYLKQGQSIEDRVKEISEKYE